MKVIIGAGGVEVVGAAGMEEWVLSVLRSRMLVVSVARSVVVGIGLGLGLGLGTGLGFIHRKIPTASTGRNSILCCAPADTQASIRGLAAATMAGVRSMA